MRNNKRILLVVVLLPLAASFPLGCDEQAGGGRAFGVQYNRTSSYQPYKASTGVGVSPNGGYVAAALMDHADVWDMATGKLVQRLAALPEKPFGIVDVYFYDDHTLITVGRDEAMRFWDVQTGKEVRRVVNEHCWYWPLAISPDRKTAVSLESPDKVCVWDMDMGKRVREFAGPSDGVLDVAFLPDGKTIVTSSNSDNEVALWDVRTGRKLKSIPAETFSVAVSPDGKKLAYRKDNAVTVYDLVADKVQYVLTPQEFGIGHFSFAFSPDGKTLAAAELGGDVILWDLADGSQIVEYPGPHGDGLDIKFHPDSRSVFTAGYRDTTIRQWPVPEGQ